MNEQCFSATSSMFHSICSDTYHIARSLGFVSACFTVLHENNCRWCWISLLPCSGLFPLLTSPYEREMCPSVIVFFLLINIIPSYCTECVWKLKQRGTLPKWIMLTLGYYLHLIWGLKNPFDFDMDKHN